VGRKAGALRNEMNRVFFLHDTELDNR
jgi:hypothetical protein